MIAGASGILLLRCRILGMEKYWCDAVQQLLIVDDMTANDDQLQLFFGSVFMAEFLLFFIDLHEAKGISTLQPDMA